MRTAVAAAAAAAVVASVVALRPTPEGTLTVAPTRDPRPSAYASAQPWALPSAEVVAASAGSGPLLPDGADFTLIAADQAGWRVIDIGTGDITRWQLTGTGGRALSRVVFVSGDDLVVNLGLGPADVIRVSPEGRTTRIARQRQAVPTLDDAAVWVHDGLSDDFGGFASLVDPDGATREHIVLPSLTRPAVGSLDGLLVTTRAGTALVSGSGTQRIAQTGTIVAADGTRIAHAACDAARTCEILIGTIDDPERHRVPLRPGDVPGGYFGPGVGAFSDDGRWLALPVFRRSAGHVSIIDVTDGVAVRVVDGSAQPFTSALAWSPDSRWLLVDSTDGVIAWDSDDFTTVALEVAPERPLDALAVR